MSVPDPAPARKFRRLGLYAPFAIALLAILVWSGAWLWLRHQAQTRLDESAAQMRAAGYEVTWRRSQLGGYPFRLNVTLTEAQIRDPSGWGLAAPRIEAQAPVYAMGRWIAAAPDGLTFIRPQGGPVDVRGRVLRASLGDLDAAPPSFSFEGRGLTFTPGPGAQPFALASAETVELHLREMSEDQGVLRFQVTDGRARLAGLFGRIAGQQPIAMVWESTLSRASAFRGPDWASAVRAWTDAGGQLVLRQGGITAGEAVLGAQSGSLTVGTDGRLRGALDVSLRQAPEALAAMSATGAISEETAAAAAAVAQARAGAGELARAMLTFQAGQTTLGPVAIGPAPRVY